MSPYIEENTRRLPGTRQSSVLRSSRKQYTPGVRVPYRLPDQKVQLPPIPPSPGAPPTFNWLTSLLPPLLILTGMGLMVGLTGMSPYALIPTVLMSAGFPIANMIGLSSQKKKYKKDVLNRENSYRRQLDRERKDLQVIAQKQRTVLEDEYPKAPLALKIAMQKGDNPRLWWRRPQDSDFLGLMIGRADGKASFSVIPPNYSDPFDPITPLPGPVVKDFEMVKELPFLVDFQTFGSVGVTSTDSALGYAAVYRLLLDLLVHHSPQDVRLAVVSDVESNVKSWEWLKWAPHTAALTEERPRRLTYTPEAINEYLEWLVKEYDSRLRDSRSSQETPEVRPAEVVIFDDLGSYRQHRALHPIIDRGHEVGIYLIFIGNRNLPRVRCKLDILGPNAFRCIETWQDGETINGEFEQVSLPDLQLAARAMAQLELSSTGFNLVLPESVRLSQVLEVNQFSENEIRANWMREKKDHELLHLPIGVSIGRDGFEPAVLNLLPEDKGGIAAYHTIMIGYTGSGKSEIMKSLILAAMYKYAPHELSFFFMDFKGGATLNIFKDLPHETGIVTNLSAEVERGLDAIQTEIDARQRKIADAHVSNIWRYNQSKQPPIAHLVIFLDEFARGLAEYPRLPAILQTLVKQGRSLGMYLFLANQTVDSNVDNLLSNVGWRIALRLAKDEELHIIDKNLHPIKRAGHGYLRDLNGDIKVFQAGYAGSPSKSGTKADASEFRIYEIGPGGGRKEIFTQSASQDLEITTTEEDALIGLLRKCADELGIEHTPHIYLPPLPENTTLSEHLAGFPLYRKYTEPGWSEPEAGRTKLRAPIGIMDIPQKRLQVTHAIDFLDKDGHLWVIGSQDAGREMTINTLLHSLAFSHTPEEIGFYIIDLGSGQLKTLEKLPHTGAVIRVSEPERLDRLFNYLEQIMESRSPGTDRREKAPQFNPSSAGAGRYCDSEHIFLVIYNYLDLRKEFNELAEKLIHFATYGKTAGIHLILVTNRGADLLHSVSDLISKRFVLKLNTKDEYYDLIGQKVQQLASDARGRGYLVDNGVAEIQVAEVDLPSETIAHMKDSWKGLQPRPILIMPECISMESLDEFIQNNAIAVDAPDSGLLPMGISYDDLNVRMVDLLEERHTWMVLGSAQKGKSNLLAYLALKAANLEEEWDIRVFTLRRNSIPELVGNAPRIWLTSRREELLPELTNLEKKLKTGSGLKHTLVMIDDIGVAFEPGREDLKAVLDSVAIQARDQENVHLIASGTIDDLRTGNATQIVRLLKQAYTGVSFAGDLLALEAFGVSPQASKAYQRVDLPLGRGFYISRSKLSLVQMPLVGKCPEFRF